MKALLHLTLLYFVVPTEQYRILCLFPFQGKSHFVVSEALCKELAKRGHQVDMISHFPQTKPRPNFRDIVNLQGTAPMVTGNFTIDQASSLNENIVYKIAVNFGNTVCELIANERMQSFIKSQPSHPSYDLVLTEFFGTPCYFAFGPFLKAPVIAIATTLEYNVLDEIIGNPSSTAFFPNSFNEKAAIESFWDRLTNVVTNFISRHILYYYTLRQNDILRRHLSPDLSDVRKIEKSVSLVLTYSHYTFHGVRPLTPALVEVGGLHIENDEAQLTPELQKWLDSANDGVVYFTLGSIVKIESMSSEVLSAFCSSFAKIAPVKVLMKVLNKEELPIALPKNVVTFPWMPQIPVLRHKNVRAFISHGGLLGSYEAMYYGVPLIGIPLFADQMRNINILVRKGMAVLLKLENLSEKSLDAALNDVLNDPTYRKAARNASALFKDRPMSAMDTAVYWLEYVIRNGPKVLRSPVMDMPWWQADLIDVYGFLILSFVLILYALSFSLKLLFKCCYARPNETAKNVRKNKEN